MDRAQISPCAHGHVPPGTALWLIFDHSPGMQRERPYRSMPTESAMYGKITKYRSDMGIGVIEAESGRKYRFSHAQIRNGAPELIGQSVDFVVVSNRPTDIIMMCGSPWTAFGGIGRR
jgi:cold shock CspA family protein